MSLSETKRKHSISRKDGRVHEQIRANSKSAPKMGSLRQQILVMRARLTLCRGAESEILICWRPAISQQR